MTEQLIPNVFSWSLPSAIQSEGRDIAESKLIQQRKGLLSCIV